MKKQLLNLKNQNGITLIEMIVALSIFIIIIFVWYNLIIKSYQTAEYGLQQQEAIHEAQRGIEIMTQEIREMSTAEDGSYALVSAGDNEIIFYSDVDQDIAAEKVRYFFDDINLKRGLTEPTGDPIEYNPADEVITTITSYTNNGTSSLFTYYNGDYPYDTDNNPLPAPARLIETKLIHIFLIVNVNPNRDPDNFLIESDVQLRNLKTNL